MTIPFERIKEQALGDPEVKAAYDALAPEFELSLELIRARMRAGLVSGRTRGANEDEPVDDRSPRKRPDISEHKNTNAVRRSHWVQSRIPPIGCLATVRNSEARLNGRSVFRNPTGAARFLLPGRRLRDCRP